MAKFQLGLLMIPDKKSDKRYKELYNIFNKGFKLFLENKYPESLNLYKKALKLDPDNNIIIQNISAVFFYLNEFDESLMYINKCLKSEPNRLSFLNMKGSILIKIRRFDDAISCYKYTKNLIFDDKHFIMTFYGDNFYNIGEYKTALKFYNKSLRFYKHYSPSLYGKALVLLKFNKKKKALKYIDKVISTNTKDIGLMFDIGKTLFDIGEYRRSIKFFEIVLKDFPEDKICLEYKNKALNNIGLKNK
jgi:tetratricopeptide (TPR) repeat protein